MNLKKKRQKEIKRLIKTEEKNLIKKVKSEYKRGRPFYKLTACELNYLNISQADKVIREYLDKEGIKFETKVVADHISLSENNTIDRIYFDFIDEEE